MPGPLGGQESVGGGAQHCVVVEAAPAPFLLVAESQFALQLLVVAFDPPAVLDQPHEVLQRSVLGHAGQEVLRRRRFRGGPCVCIYRQGPPGSAYFENSSHE